MPDQVFPISRVGPRGLWGFYLLTAAVLSVPAAVAWIATARPSPLEFVVRPTGLEVRGSRFGLSVPAGSILPLEARRLREGDLPAYAPRSRTGGVALGGYQAGRFTLNDGRGASVFVTDWSRAVVVPLADGDRLVLSPEDPAGFVAEVQNLMPRGTTAPQVFQAAEPPDGGGAGPSAAFWLTLAVIPMLVLALVIALVALGRGVRFVVAGDGTVRVRGDLYGRTIPGASLRPEGAELIDLRASARFGRMLRVNGVGVPGYLSGWFRPSGGGRALVFVTDRSRVLAVPTALGYTLLVSPADPAAFLAALGAGPR